jgi:pyridoxal phosphate-dependent aminotransferase EpsN
VTRIFLSPPDVGEEERTYLLDAFDSNWIAPLGPHVNAFEEEFQTFTAMPAAAALSSGTAALHLALLLTGVGPGDDVIVPSLTFVATANAVTYVGARPVFVDSDEATWNLDPVLLEQELAARAKTGRLPAAVLGVDLYGQCADWDALLACCATYGVPAIEDAAEALGATYGGRAAGSFGEFGVFSFNGNKIITTSGGGMLVGDDPQAIARARYLATQARDDAPHYEHSVVGYNYRMSNLLAAVGRAQLQGLPARIARRRAINLRYRELLGKECGVGFMPNDPRGEPTNWLTVATIDAEEFGATPEQVRLHLESMDIEARPAWKPMHLQPLFADASMRGGAVAERIFRTGLCLPSGSSMTDDDVDRVVEGMLAAR